MCTVKKALSGAVNTTSNFKKYLETVHKATKLVAKEPKSSGKQKIEHDENTEDDNQRPNQLKRQRILFSNSTVSPIRLRTLISE